MGLARIASVTGGVKTESSGSNIADVGLRTAYISS